MNTITSALVWTLVAGLFRQTHGQDCQRWQTIPTLLSDPKYGLQDITGCGSTWVSCIGGGYITVMDIGPDVQIGACSATNTLIEPIATTYENYKAGSFWWSSHFVGTNMRKLCINGTWYSGGAFMCSSVPFAHLDVAPEEPCQNCYARTVSTCYNDIYNLRMMNMDQAEVIAGAPESVVAKYGLCAGVTIPAKFRRCTELPECRRQWHINEAEWIYGCDAACTEATPYYCWDYVLGRFIGDSYCTSAKPAPATRPCIGGLCPATHTCVWKTTQWSGCADPYTQTGNQTRTVTCWGPGCKPGCAEAPKPLSVRECGTNESSDSFEPWTPPTSSSSSSGDRASSYASSASMSASKPVSASASVSASSGTEPVVTSSSSSSKKEEPSDSISNGINAGTAAQGMKMAVMVTTMVMVLLLI